MAQLTGEYTFEEISAETLQKIYNDLHSLIFADTLFFNHTAALTQNERDAEIRLREAFRETYRLRLAVYNGDGNPIGWSFGHQYGATDFYMTNSGILPQHRGKGIYSALLPIIMERVRSKGFQTIWSRHHPTNNAILIPKLRAGFVINKFELTDRFGTLVHLIYHFNPVRRKALAFRAGSLIPDAELRPLLGLEGE